MPTTDDQSKTTATLPGIQALRALAAGAVLVAHTGGEFNEHLSLPGVMPAFIINGGAGVDLFFVISGFVMVYSCERLFGRDGAFATFMARRLIRIVPLYWAMTTVMLAWVVVRGFAASDASPTLALASYLFIPYWRPSGSIDALYGLGWTLNYEMMFYVIFACALFARRNIAVAAASLLLVAMTVVHSLQVPMPRQLVFLTEPLILEFAFGMILALIFRAGIKLPRPACYVLMVAAATLGIAMLCTFAPTRWILWGIPAAMLVAGVVLMDKPLAMPLLVVALGDASYALYLIHPAVNFLVRHAAARGLFVNPARLPWLYLAGALCLSVLAAFAIHYGFERPTSRFLRNRFVRPRAVPVQAPAPAAAGAVPRGL